jgi:protein-S-isoprenylcysteine O-methyltransferase Ste14
MSEEVDLKSLKKTIISRFFLIYFILGLLFFLSAGTFKYWEAYIYMAVIAVPMTFFVSYMFKHNPKFLERRMKVREKREKQRVIQKLAIVPFLFSFLLPGFDRRFGWSDLPVPVTIAGLVLVLLGYLMTLQVFRTNAFASRVVDVEVEQKVITTGPYALVRHPMYFSVIIFYLFTPVALGSCWAMIPALLIIPFLIVRIIDEEKELGDNLVGYREYMQKVTYRLIPGIW